MYSLRRLMLLCFLGSFIWACTITASGSTGKAEANDYARIAVDLELMQGHLIASLENYKLGQTALAQAHAAHPLHEHYSNLPATFAKEHADLDKMIRETFTRLSQSLNQKVDVKTYASLVQDTARLLEQAGMILIPPDMRTMAAFQAAVLVHILEEIAEEYEEAIKEGKVVNLPEYQDAFGFLQRARVLREPIAAKMTDGDRRQMHALWQSLDEAIPNIMPPSTPKNVHAVETQVSAVANLFKGR